MYVYIKTETANETGTGYPLYTVGFFNPDDLWVSDSDYGGETGKQDAANRVNFLNGANSHDSDAESLKISKKLCTQNMLLGMLQDLKDIDLPNVLNFIISLIRFKDYNISQQIRYGKTVWAHTLMDDLRRIHCMCLNCGRSDCVVAKRLMKESQEYGIARIITRCPFWVSTKSNT